MPLPHVNYLAVVVSAVVIFVIGGIWYSPALFAKPWIALMGKSEEQMKAERANVSMPFMFLQAFITGLIVAWVMAVVLRHFTNPTALRGAEIGALCWLGFAGATSYTTSLFSGESKRLWAINSGYYLVSFVVAGILLSVWR